MTTETPKTEAKKADKPWNLPHEGVTILAPTLKEAVAKHKKSLKTTTS